MVLKFFIYIYNLLIATHLLIGSISVRADQPQNLFCETRGGNPAPRVVWYMDNTELPSEQVNETEAGDTKHWRVVSTLAYVFRKEMNGVELKCSVVHEALTRKMREEIVKLDVQYPPTVQLIR